MRLHSLVGGRAEIVGPEATLDEAAATMIDGKVDCVAVVEGRTLVGILTEHDIVEAVAEGADLSESPVSEWMSEAPDTFPPDVLVSEAAAWLLQTGYRHMPVIGDGELLGIVGVRDLLWAITPGATSEDA